MVFMASSIPKAQEKKEKTWKVVRDAEGKAYVVNLLKKKKGKQEAKEVPDEPLVPEAPSEVPKKKKHTFRGKKK